MTHYSELLALVLLHFVWQATAIALIYKFMDRRVAANRPGTRYNLALTALLCMFGSAVLTFFYERAHIGPASGTRDVMASAFLNSSLPNTIHIAPLLVMIHERANGIVQLIDIAWLAGVLVFFVRALGGAWMLSKIRTALSFAPGEELAQRFTDLARRLDLQHRVTLRVHAASISPFVAGTLRSVIYLPASALTSLSPDQIDAVLAHELAHVRRADYFWNLLQGAMETLFFFHPVVWWVGKILREQRELCCDDIALQCSSTPISYAKALLVLAEGQYARPRFAMPLGGQHGRKHLLSRISRILGETCIPKEGTTPAAALRLTISGTIAAIVLCCSIAMTPIKPVHALQAVFQKQFEEHPFSRSSAPLNSARVRQEKQSSRITDDGRAGAGILLPQNKQLPQEGRGVQTNQNARLAQLPQQPQVARLGHSSVGAENLSDSSEPHPTPHPNGESPHPHPGPPSPQPQPSNQN